MHEPRQSHRYQQPWLPQRDDVPEPMIPPRRRVARFRWAWLAVPAACLLAAWLFTHVHASFSWEDVMHALHVPARGFKQYSRVAVLWLALVGLTLAFKWTRK